MAMSKSAGEILEAIVEDGQEELERASPGLAFSGFAAGLNISFSVVALVVVGALTGGIGFAAYAFYPIGFLIVILARTQLFTENTVTPVAVVLSSRSRLPNMLRLWGIVLVSNLLGTATFAAAVYYGGILEPSAFVLLFEDISARIDYGFWTITIKGVFGGWLVALVAWMISASYDTISQILFIYLLILLIPATGLVHCIADSAEVLLSVFAGERTFFEYFGGFLVPATLGNMVGGVILVTLLNYGQVIASRKRKPLRDRIKRNL